MIFFAKKIKKKYSLGTFAHVALRSGGVGMGVGIFYTFSCTVSAGQGAANLATFFTMVFKTDPSLEALWQILIMGLSLVLQIIGLKIMCNTMVALAIASVAPLVIFIFMTAGSSVDFVENFYNAVSDPFTDGFSGLLQCLPVAFWLYVAIEFLPLLSEESVNVPRNAPRATIYAMGTLVSYMISM